jgi:15-cis-phytoene synthase
MTGIELYNKVCLRASRTTTRMYSTSFSLGILSLDKKYRDPIYAIYGFVRFADEIVDTFHDSPKKNLLDDFEQQTFEAIANKISLNPILHSFQWSVNTYNIGHDLIRQFLHSMRMDLNKQVHNPDSYKEYILGSAEVVGLMCLHVFTEGDLKRFEELKPQAMALGSAFQKINFLRDLKADYFSLGRAYFPGFELSSFNEEKKREIEYDIENDFRMGLDGIRKLPTGSRLGVYVAYVYYYALFGKIKSLNATTILRERIRIPNIRKYYLIFTSYLRHTFNLI